MSNTSKFRDLSVKLVDDNVLRRFKVISASENIKMPETLALLVNLYEETELYEDDEYSPEEE